PRAVAVGRVEARHGDCRVPKRRSMRSRPPPLRMRTVAVVANMSAAILQRALALIEANDPGGVEQVRELASAGDRDALYLLAQLHWTGTLAPQDPMRARQLFEAAAGRGHMQANLIMTNLLASGVAGARKW